MVGKTVVKIIEKSMMIWEGEVLREAAEMAKVNSTE